MPGLVRLLLGNVRLVFWGAVLIYPLLQRLGIMQRIRRWFWS